MDTLQPLTISLNKERGTHPGAIFVRAIRESAGGILVWSIALSVVIVLGSYVYPILRENNIVLNLLAGFGILDRFAGNYGLDATTLVSFKGFLALQFLDWLPLILSLYTIPKTLNIVLDEEKRGTLDILLSTPIPRWQFLVEKSLALLVALATILFIMWGTLVMCSALIPAANITTFEATTAVWHLLPISTAIASFGLFFSVIFRQQRTAAGVAGAFVLVSYFVRSIADTTRAEFLLDLKQFSIFNYFSAITMMSYGPQLRWDLILLTVALVMFALSLVLFQQRDIQP